MEILAFILVFVVGALIAASEGDFTGIAIIGKVVFTIVFTFGTMYALAACMGAFN